MSHVERRPFGLPAGGDGVPNMWSVPSEPAEGTFVRGRGFALAIVLGVSFWSGVALLIWYL